MFKWYEQHQHFVCIGRCLFLLFFCRGIIAGMLRVALCERRSRWFKDNELNRRESVACRQIIFRARGEFWASAKSVNKISEAISATIKDYLRSHRRACCRFSLGFTRAGSIFITLPLKDCCAFRRNFRSISMNLHWIISDPRVFNWRADCVWRHSPAVQCWADRECHLPSGLLITPPATRADDEVSWLMFRCRWMLRSHATSARCWMIREEEVENLIYDWTISILFMAKRAENANSKH